jgi:hypothetical protein
MSRIATLPVSLLALSAAVVSVEGCKNGPPPVMAVRHVLKGSKEHHGGTIAQGDVLKLTDSTDGTAVKGIDFKVALASKAGDNHEWQCRTPNDAYVLVDASFDVEPAGAQAAGTELHTIFHLHARAVGKTKVEFALVNTVDKNVAAAKTIALTVDVKEK